MTDLDLRPRSRRVVPRPAVSVEELRRAWYAVQAGDFRRTPSRPARPTPADGTGQDWAASPGERVVPVVGAAGSVGASTVALALAEAAHGPGRVVECCPAPWSGLAAASTAELGVHDAGWRQGRRGEVLLERTCAPHADPREIPEPTPAAHEDQLTILDAGWDPVHLATGIGWLPRAIRTAPALVVVTTATVPGFRRLETALELLDVDHPSALDRMAVDRVALALVGPSRGSRRRRGVERSAGPAVARLLTSGSVVEIPHERGLAVAGVDSRPLPERLVAAAARLLGLLAPTGP